MALNTIADLSTTAGTNVDVLGQNASGSGSANTIDTLFQNLMALMARAYGDIGGLGTVGGSANAVTLTSKSTYQALENGLTLSFKAASANTGATTLNLDGLGAKAIRRQGDSALSANDIVANGRYLVQYDEAYNSAAGAWVLLNPAIADLAIATAANFRANTADKVLDTDGVWAAAAEVTLTDAATIAFDQSTGINFKVTLGGNRTMGQPSNTINGKTGRIIVKQDATGSRTLSWHADFEFASGAAPALTTTAGAEDVFYYDQLAANRTLITGPVRAVA